MADGNENPLIPDAGLPDAKRQKAEAAARTRLEAYYKQLTQGCGRSDCANQYCASCSDAPADQREPNNAARVALQLMRSDDRLCLPQVLVSTPGGSAAADDIDAEFPSSPAESSNTGAAAAAAAAHVKAQYNINVSPASFDGFKRHMNSPFGDAFKDSPFVIHKAASPERLMAESKIPYMTLSGIKGMVEVAELAGGEYREVVALVGRVFSSVESLNSSFLRLRGVVPNDKIGLPATPDKFGLPRSPLAGGSPGSGRKGKERAAAVAATAAAAAAAAATAAGSSDVGGDTGDNDDGFGDDEALAAAVAAAEEAAFSTPSGANKSVKLVSAEPHFVDLDAARECFELLLGIDAVRGAVETAFSTLVTSVSVLTPSLTEASKLRFVLVVLENPMWMDPSNGVVFGKFLSALSALPEAGRGIVTAWLADFDQERFAERVVSIVQYITLRSYMLDLSPHEDAMVINAVKTLALFNEANKVAEHLPHTAFYNDAVIEKIDLKEEYFRWMQFDGYEGQFAFCNYSFVLDAAAKSDILKLESLVQMRHEMQNAFFASMMQGHGPQSPYLVLRVHRERLVQDALTQLQLAPMDLKKQLKVKFLGEDGVDEGGVTKEFFQVILRDLFDPAFGMFKEDPDTRTFWFNPHSFDSPNEFALIGMLLGIAIYNSVILNLALPPVIYKMLCKREVTFEDFLAAMPSVGRSLQFLLDHDGNVEEDFGLFFEYSGESFGVPYTEELKAGGSEIPVTNANRREYCDLYARHVLVNSVKTQYDAFAEGFQRVCGGAALELFLPEELELLICGSRELDFEALERATVYDDGYDADSPTIRNFWEVVHELPMELKKKLLVFATGSDRAPINGLSSLRFVITRSGPDSDRLPTSHTCFNHLLIPDYSSKEKLKERLETAIGNSEGFGMI